MERDRVKKDGQTKEKNFRLTNNFKIGPRNNSMEEQIQNQAEENLAEVQFRNQAEEWKFKVFEEVNSNLVESKPRRGSDFKHDTDSLARETLYYGTLYYRDQDSRCLTTTKKKSGGFRRALDYEPEIFKGESSNITVSLARETQYYGTLYYGNQDYNRNQDSRRHTPTKMEARALDFELENFKDQSSKDTDSLARETLYYGTLYYENQDSRWLASTKKNVREVPEHTPIRNLSGIDNVKKVSEKKLAKNNSKRILKDCLTSIKKKHKGEAPSRNLLRMDYGMEIYEQKQAEDNSRLLNDELSSDHFRMLDKNMENLETFLVPDTMKTQEKMIVPSTPIKKHHERKKRGVHQFLKKKISSYVIGGLDTEREHNVVQRRAQSFITRMHPVQGDRSFKPWNGSVVDSVVGVFLTHKSTDQQSSDAFMLLAAKFPITNSREEVGVSSNLGSLQVSPKASGGDYSPNIKYFKSLKGQKRSSDDATLKTKDKKVKTKKKEEYHHDWDSLRREVEGRKGERERTTRTMDYVDWEAVRTADYGEVCNIIKGSGTQNVTARRIQAFLNRLVKDHGSINLEWLKDVLPYQAEEYLLSVHGLGQKSIECVQLLALHNRAFPVDTNVARIVARLGWVQPLPESILLHDLEMYPDLIQEYLWPGLRKLHHQTLYELHYHMITFGKVFCKEKKPNCNACPMRDECKYVASERLASTDTKKIIGTPEKNPLPLSEVMMHTEPINKVTCLHEPGRAHVPLPDIEDAGFGFKNISKQRTEHRVYELPDAHHLLDKFEKREQDDHPYLLAIWTRGGTSNCSKTGEFCDEETCFSCKETRSETVQGTILIPCKTAMIGGFPLNGTYFQTNEVFADHDSSKRPINVSAELLHNLHRKTVYFGSSIPSIFKGLSTQLIKQCFVRGYVCVRGFNRKKGKPERLIVGLD